VIIVWVTASVAW